MSLEIRSLEKFSTVLKPYVPNQNLLMLFWVTLPLLNEILQAEFFDKMGKELSPKTRRHYFIWGRRAFRRLYETIKNRCFDTPDAFLNPLFLDEYLTMLKRRYSTNAQWLMIRFTAFWLNYMFPDRYPLVNPNTLASALQNSSSPEEFEDSLRKIDPLFTESNREWIRRSYRTLCMIYRVPNRSIVTSANEVVSGK